MDFAQTKLTKMEWESIEAPLPDTEKRILRLIMDGYYDLQIQQNDNQSLLSFMKIEYTPEIEMYIYTKYFEPEIRIILGTPSTTIKPHKKSSSSTSSSKTGTAAGASPPTPHFLEGFRPQLPNMAKFKPPKKIDLMRLQNMDTSLQTAEFDKSRIFEYTLLDFCRRVVHPESATPGTPSYTYYLYTILHMTRAAIPHVNTFVQAFVTQLTQFVQTKYGAKLIRDTFDHAHTIIEKNPHILRFENRTLYDHQKQLFQLFRPRLPDPDTGLYPPLPAPKLVLYTAPTGTGKTMSPLGLANGYRVIYICAARHIGLALAKSAISVEKRVAFAFGCETASDIRLHYYSAIEYTKNRKTGGIYKVDNSNGSKVEIMICDIHSYLTAMHYMLAFNDPTDMILYWDEPTIALDVAEHPLHTLIQRNWQENKVANVVLSCATLPDAGEIPQCLAGYRARFDDATVHRVSSHDCKKSISMVNPQGRATLPHLLFDRHQDIRRCVDHIERHRSLLRYLDLREIVRMVGYVQEMAGLLPEAFQVSQYFMSVADITMNSIKQYYLEVLRHLPPERYGLVHEVLKATQRPMFDASASGTGSLTKTHSLPGPGPSGAELQGKVLERRASVQALVPPTPATPTSAPAPTFSPELARSQSTNPFRGGMATAPSPFKGVLLTTEDAHTLTDGPTIYITEDVQKLSQFYIHQSKIPTKVFDRLLEKIESNNVIQKKMDVLSKAIDDGMGSEADKDKKVEKEAFKPEIKRMMAGLEDLRAQIKMISMSPEYIPNTRQHQQIWVMAKHPDADMVPNAFTSQIDETAVKKIMELDVENPMKLLLLMGVGVFDTQQQQSKHPGTASYLEVMKRLAYEQKLFLIIASSDYIYGTNYQLCHGFLGKDLLNMTQQKIIQAMGRIGRSSIQQEYTIRFRDEGLLGRLFLPMEGENMEAVNMERWMSL